MSILQTNDLKKYYGRGDTLVKALDGVDFAVKEREFTAIIGKSGSGKSTLLHMIGGLDTPTAGEVYVDGRKLSDMNREQLAVFRRRKVGFVFQSYNLVPDLNVYENVVLPIELDGKRIDRRFVREILELLQIDGKAEALPGMLSGGQQQRVAIARAVAAKPGIILADEPTGNLDTASGHDVMGLLKVAAKQFQQTVILITHDNDIAQMADRTVHIEDGRIVKADFGGTTTSDLVDGLSTVRIAGGALTLVLSCLAIFLISNTIKTTIYSRSHEIAIMRNVGATNGFIKMPFMIEGMIIGLIGAIIPMLITFFGYRYLYGVTGGKVLSSAMFTLQPIYPFVLQVCGLLLLAGIVVGLVGSFLAVTKYLRWKR